MNDNQVTDYLQGDEQEILQLFRQVFKKHRSQSHWKWENMESPAGPSIITLLKDKDKVKGHLALQRVIMKLGNETAAASQRICSMLHKDYREQGHYQRMLHHLLQQAEEQGVKLTYSFPNVQALKALRKTSGLIEVAQIPRFVKVYKPYVAARTFFSHRMLSLLLGTGLSLRNVVKKGYRGRSQDVFAVESVDERFDRLWQSCSNRLNVAVVRDAEYLQWRYFRSPNNYTVFVCRAEDELKGYIVLTVEGNRGYVVDLLATTDQAYAGLLARADEYFESAGCHTAFCWCLGNRVMSSHMRKHGFFRRGEPNALVVNDIQMSDTQRKLISSCRNWFITMGDSDYY